MHSHKPEKLEDEHERTFIMQIAFWENLYHDGHEMYLDANKLKRMRMKMYTSVRICNTIKSCVTVR